MKKIIQKLNSQKGETISEVLVAALISVMALLLLASMIMSASRMVSRSDEKMSAFYEQVSAVESGTTEITDKEIVDLPDSPDTDKINIEWQVNGTADVPQIDVTITKETNSGLTAYKKTD